MPKSPLDTLKEVFGYTSFRPFQQEIVERLISGEDLFVLMPTGGGKSLCYQLPALHRPGVAIVVSPLISLMKDQVDALTAAGVRAASYNSSLPAAEARRVLARLHDGELDLLYVAPERLMSDAFLERLAGDRNRPVRHRRGPLHLPVGPRFPAGIPPARAACARPCPGRRSSP